MLIDGPQGSSDPAATNAKVDELLEATAGGTMSDLDGRMEESLRSNLFVPGMDLGSRNIFRGREVGVVSYRRLALCYRAFPSPLVRPNPCHPRCVLRLVACPTPRPPPAPPAVIRLQQRVRAHSSAPLTPQRCACAEGHG